MNLDPRKSEHSLASYSPLKHNQSQALKDEVEAFLAQLKTDLGDRLWSRFQDGGLTVVECNWADARTGGDHG